MEILGTVICLLSTGCSCVWFHSDDQFSYGLTAAHCIRNQDETPIATNNGKRFRVRILQIDRANDLALIKADKQHTGELHATVSAAHTGPVILVGFPAGKLTILEGSMTDEAHRIDGGPKQLIETKQPIIGGFSGGAVFNNQGLTAIITHSIRTTRRHSTYEPAQATTPADSTNAGCSILDQFIDRQADRQINKIENRATSTLDEQLKINVRDCFFAAIAAWATRHFTKLKKHPATHE